MKDLATALSDIPAGPLEGDDHATALRALEEHWDALRGSEVESTTADKLYRAEDLTWAPPVLTFRLERHGRTVNSSTRADHHYWEVNVDTGEARIVRRGHINLYPQNKRFTAQKPAREIADRILVGETHETLKWIGEDTVRVNIAVVVPGVGQQTTTGRRRRFYKALEELLNQHGWTQIRRGTSISFVRQKR